MDKLESSNLAELNNDIFQLTKEGRDYALRMVRLHRLWEKYLAEETGIPESAWHMEADFKEHHLTAEQAEQISRRLGNPVYDPHGAPIPTPKGEIKLELGIPLARFEAGSNAIISHIEDEPYTANTDLL